MINNSLFSFSGAIGRWNYFKNMILLVLSGTLAAAGVIFLMGASIFLGGKNFTPTSFMLLAIFAVIWLASIGLPVRRFRDIVGDGRNGLIAMLTLSLFIPIIGFFTALYAFFAPGIYHSDASPTGGVKNPISHSQSNDYSGSELSAEFIVVIAVILAFALGMGTYSYAVLGPAAQASNELKQAIAQDQPKLDFAIGALDISQRRLVRSSITLLLIDADQGFTEGAKVRRALKLYQDLRSLVDDNELTPKEWEDWTTRVESRAESG